MVPCCPRNLAANLEPGCDRRSAPLGQSLWQGTATFHGDPLHRHYRFPSVRLALHRDAQTAPLSPKQHEHQHGKYGALHRPGEMREGLGLLT